MNILMTSSDLQTQQQINAALEKAGMPQNK